MTDHERRLIAAADAFTSAFPAMTARRAFAVLPGADRDRADEAYAELFEASLDYFQSLPLDVQIAYHQRRREENR